MKKRDNTTMVIDHYELTMGQGYFDAGVKDTKTYFDIFFRENPFEGGYTISGGLADIIDYIDNLHFDEDDIEYFRSKGYFSEEFLEYLRKFKFTGDIYAVPDGTAVFPNEPVLTVKANVIEAQVIETALLAEFNHCSLVTTKAKRITDAAKGRPVMEFGARRARGRQSSIQASKCAYIGGFCGTSNEQTAKEEDIPALGTMAHSFVLFFDSEYEAFLNFAKSNPNNCTFLVDTYDTLKSGIPNAIKVAQEYLIPNGLEFKGIRIDSGDLAYLTKEARKMLDEAGFYNTKICVSNSLDEYTISSLLEQGAQIDNFGVGERASASKERVAGVYKLSAREKGNEIIAKIKLSNDSGKTTNPDYKKVYRFYDKDTGYALGDVIARADEIIPEDKYTLVSPTDSWKKTTITNYNVREMLVPIYINGKKVYKEVTAKESKDYCQKEVETLYPEIRRILNPHIYYVDLSEKLLEEKNQMIKDIYDNMPKDKPKVRARRLENNHV